MKVSNVIEKLTQIVEQKVKYYKTDFYDYDKGEIELAKPCEFVWMCRDTGTHILFFDMFEEGDRLRTWYNAFKSANERVYLVRIEEYGSGEVTLSEHRCDEAIEKAASKLVG